jgi:tRNA modification GTPase
MTISTIAAISTPQGSGGIGIVKISGPKAIDIAQSVFVRGFSPSGAPQNHAVEKEIHEFESRRLVYGHIVDSESRQVLDEVLLAVMRAPHSYTAEDVVEIQAHASPLILKSILSLLLKRGAVLAEPGEFTKRAFLNGRMDLTQAEAVIDMINARSSKAADMAFAHLSGGFAEIIKSLRSEILTLLSSIEAAIDFPDDVGEDIEIEKFVASIEEEMLPRISALISRHDDVNFLREGLKAVIVGGPNVGKSSLLNRLVNRERAIVTEFPGTTRDFIEDSFITRGIPIIVTDTAGIHESPDPVERVGIEKAWEYMSRADILLYTVDAGKPVSANDLSLFRQLSDKKIILVINKTDLPREKILFLVPEEWRDIPKIEISALYNRGIDELKNFIANLAVDATPQMENAIVPNVRHKTALEKARSALSAVLSGSRAGVSFELISMDLHSVIDAFSEITGESIGADVLDEIFNRFCIGK